MILGFLSPLLVRFKKRGNQDNNKNFYKTDIFSS
jgi:hypothetical protein